MNQIIASSPNAGLIFHSFTRIECLKAMNDAIKKHEKEIKILKFNFKQVENLKKNKFYELMLNGMVLLVQYLRTAHNFGNPVVKFRLLACSVPENKARDRFASIQEEFLWSCDWEWKQRLIDPKDAPLYINYLWKTPYYKDFLKGKKTI
jgi:hypothetical protein